MDSLCQWNLFVRNLTKYAWVDFGDLGDILRGYGSSKIRLSLFISYAFDGASFCSTTRLDLSLRSSWLSIILGGAFLTPDSALEVLLEVCA
jgi:hypothetical protein